MKIAYLSTFYPFRGGIAQYNAALYRAFEKDNEIKAFNFKRQYPDILFPGSSQYVTPTDVIDKTPSERVLDSINPISYLKTGLKIKNFQPTIMLTKFWMPFFAPSLGTVAYLNKKKTKNISILDNVIPHERRPGDISLTKFFLNQNHGFVVMSDAVKNDLLKLKPEAKYIYHPHPLFDHFGEKLEKSDARLKLNINPNKKVILFFGFIRDYKGLDLLIKAMKNTPEDYYLVIAGETYGNFDEYEKLITELGIASKIQLNVRYINDTEVPYFFSAADVCVLPYKSATQSGITSIAYHFNLPVIATDTGGLKEIVKHGETGLIVDKPDAQLINSSIKDFFNKDLAGQYEDNIKRYKADISWDHLAQKIISFYSEL